MAKAAKKPAPAAKAKTAKKPKTVAKKAAAKPAAKARPAPARKPSAKARPVAVAKKKSTAVARKPTTKAVKPAAKAPAKKAAPAKPKTAVKAKPSTSVVKAKASSKMADDRSSALEPKAGVAARKPTTTVTKKSTTSRSAKTADVQTDRYEAARPGTAVIARAEGRPVEIKGVDGSRSPFSAKELKTWRAILMQKRADMTDDIADLRKDAMDAEDGHTTPNHIAERGSDADLQDLSLGVADDEELTILQIDRALRKIELGRPMAFGICEHTAEPIAVSRLELMPWTPLSIEGAEHMERQGLSIEDMLIED